MDYQYFYITWSLIFLTIWLILYLHRKDLRGDMLFISFFFGLGGVICQFAHIADWWQPLTLLGTAVGIEDFIIGWAIGGIASVIYIELYHLRFKPERHLQNMKSKKHYFMGDIFLFTFALVFLGMFYLAHLPSFYAVFIAYLSGILIMAFYRQDLIVDSLVSGIIMLVLGALIGPLYEFVRNKKLTLR